MPPPLLIIGNEREQSECARKFAALEQTVASSWESAQTAVNTGTIVFDFESGLGRNLLNHYADGQVVFVNSVFTTVSQLVSEAGNVRAHVYGFNGLPSFVDRSVLEVVVGPGGSTEELMEVTTLLHTDFEIVHDRPGMITPLVIAMIINEAYRTYEEGIASRADIDLAMKLGTNYPYGPFEWSQRIGLGNVTRVLRAAHAFTQDERYALSNLLEKEAQSN